MKPDAPSLGSSIKASAMKHTPKAPPAHIHRGALLMNPRDGSGKRRAMITGNNTAILTSNDARVAHKGWPRPRLRLALIAL
ncbi:hypothetical protein D3C75_1121650 [compost metagenome]